MTLIADQQKCWILSRPASKADQLRLEHSLRHLCLKHHIIPAPTLRFYQGGTSRPAFTTIPEYNAILVSDEIMEHIPDSAVQRAIVALGTAEILCRHGNNNHPLKIDRLATQLIGEAAPLSALLTHLKSTVPATIPNREYIMGNLTVRMASLTKTLAPEMDAQIESLIALHQLKPAMAMARSR